MDYKLFFETIFLGLSLILTAKRVTSQTNSQQESLKCTLLEDSTWDCVCTEPNKVFVLHHSPYFIICNSNLKIQVMKSAGSYSSSVSSARKKPVSTTTTAPGKINNRLQNSDENLFRKLFMGLRPSEKPKEAVVAKDKETNQKTRIAMLLKNLEMYRKSEAAINRNSAQTTTNGNSHGGNGELTKALLQDKLDQLQTNKGTKATSKQPQERTEQEKTSANNKLLEQFEAFKKAMQEKLIASENRNKVKNLQVTEKQYPAPTTRANGVSPKKATNNIPVREITTPNILPTTQKNDKSNSLINQHSSVQQHKQTVGKVEITTTATTTTTTRYKGCEFNGKILALGESSSEDYIGCVYKCIARDNLTRKCQPKFG